MARELYGDRLLSMIATVRNLCKLHQAWPQNERFHIHLQTQEFDDNFDGKPDVITISATARGANIEVHSAKILLDFDYKIKVWGSNSTTWDSGCSDPCTILKPLLLKLS